MLCFFAEVIRMNPLLATAKNPVIKQEVAKWLQGSSDQGGERKKRDDMRRAEMVLDSDNMRRAEMVRDSDDMRRAEMVPDSDYMRRAEMVRDSDYMRRAEMVREQYYIAGCIFSHLCNCVQ